MIFFLHYKTVKTEVSARCLVLIRKKISFIFNGNMMKHVTSHLYEMYGTFPGCNYYSCYDGGTDSIYFQCRPWVSLRNHTI